MLITPDIIESQCIDVLTRRHPEHLAALERQLSLSPQTIERFQTIDLLAGGGFRMRDDRPPAVLLGIFATAGPPERNKHRALNVTWTLAMQIIVIGTDRKDTLKRRGWYAMTVVECVLSRLPRASVPIDRLECMDIDLVSGADEKTQRTVAEAQLLFDVTVRDCVSYDLLPSDDSAIPAGTPGGAPATPYGVPLPWPTAGTPTVTVDVD